MCQDVATMPFTQGNGFGTTETLADDTLTDVSFPNNEA